MSLLNKQVDFVKGAPFFSQVNAEKLNGLRDMTVSEVVGGKIELVPGRGSRITIPKKVDSEVRAVVVSGGTIDATAGVNVPITQLDSDVDITDAAEAVLISLTSNQITFRKVGTYIATYHCNCELDLAGATTHIGQPVTIETEFYIGGSTFTGVSVGSFGSMQVGNFGGFLKTDGDLELYTDLSGLTSFSAVFEKDSFLNCDATLTSTPTFEYDDIYVTGGTVATTASGCSEALIAGTTLEGDNTLKSTVPSSTNKDATTNIDRIAAYDTTGESHGVTSGTIIIKVIRDADDGGNLKILSGGIKYDPYITVYAVKTSSVGTTIVNNTSVSIFQL